MHLKSSPSMTDSPDAISQDSVAHFHLLTGLHRGRVIWFAVAMLHKVSLNPGVHSHSETEKDS